MLISEDENLGVNYYLKFHSFLGWEGLEPVKPMAYLAAAPVVLATSVDHRLAYFPWIVYVAPQFLGWINDRIKVTSHKNFIEILTSRRAWKAAVRCNGSGGWWMKFECSWHTCHFFWLDWSRNTSWSKYRSLQMRTWEEETTSFQFYSMRKQDS